MNWTRNSNGKKQRADPATQETTSAKRRSQIGNLHLKLFVTMSSYYDMPQISKCDVLPKSLIPFNQAMTSRDYESCVHFFIDDYQFERIWNTPKRYIDTLKRFNSVIAPDFSQYIDMPYPQRIWNNYRGKFIGALLQSQGINVIPNVTWSLPDSYDYCFNGIPENSVIAINSTGAARSGFSRFLWLKGYREAIRRLTPLAIIRYGCVIDGEDTDKAIFFYNARIKELRENGR